MAFYGITIKPIDAAESELDARNEVDEISSVAQTDDAPSRPVDSAAPDQPTDDAVPADKFRGRGRTRGSYFPVLLDLVKKEIDRRHHVLGIDDHELSDAVYDFEIITDNCNRRKLLDLFIPRLKEKGVEKLPAESTLQSAVQSILAELKAKP